MTVMFPEGDCGKQGMPVPTEFPAPVTTGPEISERAAPEIDYFTQARKALSERCPFDDKDENWNPVKATLPSGLAALLNQGSDNRKKRRKKSHSGAEMKKLTGGRGLNIWNETEEYFRDLALPDIDTLLEASSLPSSLVASECFSIPVFTENDLRVNVVFSSENEKGNDENVDNVFVRSEDGFVGVDNVNDKVDSVSDKIDCVHDKVDSVNDKDHATFDTSECAVSLAWLLGCRNKVSLTSERPSKKRKLLGGDAGLEKVLITIPSDGNLSYCHYCGRGGSGLESNRLIVCGSCKVAVHRKCYGVLGNVDDESWLCSWCERKDEISETANPCVLCPNKGGALKPVSRRVEGVVESVQFAHLFCCLWTPEVYVDDLKKMEPIANVDGIEESRRKLVCNVCKVKSGACVRCSNGSCRISFHPSCAREARHRMEVWAKECSDNVELRAFCFKHSHLQENSSILPSRDSVAVGSEFSDANGLQVSLSVTNQNNLKSGCRNGDNIGIISDGSPDKLSHNEPEDGGSLNSRLNTHDISGCDADQHLYNTGAVGRSNENVNASDTLKYALVWKKLIEKGKIDVKDVALQIGISPEALTPNIYVMEACMPPDVRLKIVNWLKDHVYTNACHKGLKVKFKPINSSKDEDGATDNSDASLISDPGFLDPDAVKSVPPRRRTISNIKILKDNEMICSSEAVTSENRTPMDKFIVGEPDCENPGTSNEVYVPRVTEENLTKSEDTLPEVQCNADKSNKSSLTGCISDEKMTICLQRASVLSEQHLPVCSNSEVPDSGSTRIEAISSYIHPYISKELLQIHNGVLLEDIICPRGEGNSSLVESSRASGHSSNQYQHLTCIDDCKSDQVNMEQLVNTREMGVLEYSPEDEVEGELVYFQHRLLQNAVRRRQIADNLIFSVAESLPQEIDTAHQHRWDAVLVNQYMYDLREAKKRGRKERKHKEAQAVLAAATAAATSPRVSSFRKDSLAESVQQDLIKLDTLSGRAGVCSQPMPRAKETLSRLAVTRTSSEKYSDFGLPSSNLSKEHPRLCDICRRPETLSNSILVCSGCKVAVHLDCYSSGEETTGPWYCELCEDLSSRTSGAPAINFGEKPYFFAECALCGGTNGAFRKSSDSQWVHAFCAEWIFELTFKRGQVNAVEGMETVLKGVDICCICRHKHGVCIKCNFGNCQTKFHPSCARSAGLYMNVSAAPSKPHLKPHHKAYCERHGSEQRAKAEAQKHGIEELRNLKQIRVELERLRLLCERIVRREKIKRELVLCSQDMLAFKRDHVARSVLAQSSFILPGGSSESATTSLKVNTEGNRSCSEVVQRSDDVTVDSSVSNKHHVRVAVSMDTDPKLDDDCSTSHSNYNNKIAERVQYSGKQIPDRASAISHNLDDGGWRSKTRKLQHADTFGKELVMTSDEASMKNSMLPKGYAYVPADCLSNDDMQSNQDVDANGSVEHDG